jgi:DNA (cytosine-5)-methyltransferase 1
MENVPGITAPPAKQNLDREISLLKGYDVVGPLTLDAFDFGAPTRRRRVVVIGYDPSSVEHVTEDDVRSLCDAKRRTVRDAIRDLPEPSSALSGRYRKVGKPSDYAVWARSLPPNYLGSPTARARTSFGIVTGIQMTRHTPEVISRFRGVQQGATEPISRCTRLHWNRPAPTLRAGTGPERGSFQSVRPIHPSVPRVISVREAARLQGFPDWFDFHETKWHSFRMIGNSVSPIMAEALLKLVLCKLKKS